MNWLDLSLEITHGILTTGEDSELSNIAYDNYLRFYLKYIEKNISKINRNSICFKIINILYLNGIVLLGFQFENLVLNNRLHIHQILGIRQEDNYLVKIHFFNKN